MSEGETKTPADTEATPDPVPVPKIRHDFYQTETFVIVTILAKNVDAQKTKIDIADRSLSVTAPLPSGSEYSLELDLAHNINPEQSSYRISPAKIEIKLRKVDGIRWLKLEGDPCEAAAKPATLMAGPASSGPPRYPSSSKNAKDWDKVQIDDDKPEGEAALNALFQKIYADGNDEIKKAMNKSFSESGGTVLSTNWNEVGGGKVDVKPPDGQEFRKWN